MKKDRQRVASRNSFFMHENECFICLREENQDQPFNYCDLCTRSYHVQCEKLQLNANSQQMCSCCQTDRKCEFCQNVPENIENTVLCTLCLSPAHSNCYWGVKGVFQNLTDQERDGLVFQTKSYVCRNCFMRNGIYQIKKVLRLGTVKNFEVEEKVLSLVKVKSKSPIHFGWFTEADIRKSFAAQKQNTFFSKKYKEFRVFHPKYISFGPKIEKILAVRFPNQKNPSNKYEEALGLLRDKNRNKSLRFGCDQNFKFLVKWQKGEYSGSTWEDEFVVKKIDKSNFFIQKFIHQHLGDAGVDKYAFIDLNEKQKLYDHSAKDEEILKMSKFRWRYPIEIIINDQGEKSSSLLCEYLNQLYILERQKYPTVLIVPESKLLQWQQSLISVSRNINIVCLVGSSKSHGLIRNIQFSHKNGSPRFDVLLLSYETFQKQKERDYILFYLTRTAIYMCVDFQTPSFINNFQGKALADHLIFVVNRVINNSSLESQRVKQICHYFQRNMILKHTMSWNEIEVISVKKNEEEGMGIQLRKGESQEARMIKAEPLPQLKRVAFLSYLLMYGLEIEKLDQIHRKMLTKCREIYDLSYQPAIKLFKAYIRGFFSVLTHYKQIDIPKETLNHYFFGLDPEAIIKRAMQLNRLRCLCKEKSYTFSINPMEEENPSEEMVVLKSWNSNDDKILGNLIIQEGFGNWEKICKNVSWNQYTESNSEQISFSAYIKIKSIIDKKFNIDASTFVRQRSQLLLSCSSSCC